MQIMGAKLIKLFEKMGDVGAVIYKKRELTPCYVVFIGYRQLLVSYSKVWCEITNLS